MIVDSWRHRIALLHHKVAPMRSPLLKIGVVVAVVASSLSQAQPLRGESAEPSQQAPRTPVFTSDPGRWRPVAYSDLLFPIGEAQSYASIWQDRLDESNARPPPLALPGIRPDPRMSLAVGNRGASEWHFSITFQTKIVAVTVLNTPHVCTDEYPSPALGTKIKVCPMRLATFQGGTYSIIDGAACFLEKQPDRPLEDSTATVTYAAYDIPTRAIKLRYTVAHQEIPQCAQSVPLHQSASQ